MRLLTTEAWARSGKPVAPSGPIARQTKPRYALLFSRWPPRAPAIWATIQMWSSTTPISDEFSFLSKPGQADIQTDLFYDYRTNVDAYPKWQSWMRETKPRLLVIWGKHDPSFDLSEPESYRNDVPDA